MFGFIGELFNFILYQPILNFLVWLYVVIGSFGIAVIILTAIIRGALLPLNAKALKSQKETQEIQPLMKAIQDKYKDDKQKQSEELMKLYKEKGFNPFASFGVLLIQIPIILALYQVIRNIANGSELNSLYSFVPNPGTIDFMFLGIDLAVPSIILAVIVAIFQFLQIKTSQVATKKPEEKKKDDSMSKMQDMMQKQMLIFLPLFTLFILTQLPAALGLYWLIITIFTIVQQKIIFKN